MANYNITKFDGTNITIVDQTLNQDFTITLLGQNYVGYGGVVAQNFIQHLENFAGQDQPERAIRGQLWYHIEIPGEPGTMKVWTGVDPTDLAYNPLSDDSGLLANISEWKPVGPKKISETNIGTSLDRWDEIWCNYINSLQGDFQELFVGNGTYISPTSGVYINQNGLFAVPDSTADGIGVKIGDLTERFREIHVRNGFIHNRLEIGNQSNNQNISIKADNTQDYTLIPDGTVHLGIATAGKRFSSVNATAVDTLTLKVGVGAGEGLDSDLLPTATNTYDIGASNLRIDNVYANNMNAETIVRASATATIGTSVNPFQDVYAVTFNGTATQALYADLAERYEADAPYQYGTVVKIGGDKEITQTTEQNDYDVFGVISKDPAYMMNSAAGSDDTHPYVAMTGRVPVKVVGKVKKGQRLVSSSEAGHAIAVSNLMIDNFSYLSIIGRALEDKDTDESGYVLAVVGVK